MEEVDEKMKKISPTKKIQIVKETLDDYSWMLMNDRKKIEYFDKNEANLLIKYYKLKENGVKNENK